MKYLTEAKARYLRPNDAFFGKSKIGANGLKYQLCRMLSDNDGILKAKVEDTAEIFYPNLDQIVLIPDTNL